MTTDDQANRALRPAVILWAFSGLIGIPAAVYFDLLGGWRWPPYNAIYDQMIVSVYFALGVCAARAVKNPIRHGSFLWFVAISSFTHGLVMLFHALHEPAHLHHLFGDVWILQIHLRNDRHSRHRFFVCNFDEASSSPQSHAQENSNKVQHR